MRAGADNGVTTFNVLNKMTTIAEGGGSVVRVAKQPILNALSQATTSVERNEVGEQHHSMDALSKITMIAGGVRQRNNRRGC